MCEYQWFEINFQSVYCENFLLCAVSDLYLKYRLIEYGLAVLNDVSHMLAYTARRMCVPILTTGVLFSRDVTWLHILATKLRTLVGAQRIKILDDA
jgi:hypothetical protein